MKCTWNRGQESCRRPVAPEFPFCSEHMLLCVEIAKKHGNGEQKAMEAFAIALLKAVASRLGATATGAGAALISSYWHEIWTFGQFVVEHVRFDSGDVLVQQEIPSLRFGNGSSLGLADATGGKSIVQYFPTAWSQPQGIEDFFQENSDYLKSLAREAEEPLTSELKEPWPR